MVVHPTDQTNARDESGGAGTGKGTRLYFLTFMVATGTLSALLPGEETGLLVRLLLFFVGLGSGWFLALFVFFVGALGVYILHRIVFGPDRLKGFVGVLWEFRGIPWVIALFVTITQTMEHAGSWAMLPYGAASMALLMLPWQDWWRGPDGPETPSRPEERPSEP